MLFTHIPLFRPDGEDCKRVRKSPFRQGWGRDYQNMLSPVTSKRILDTIRPIQVFSGDDHEPCEFHHGSAVENTLSTFSFLQGNLNPGFGIFSTSNATQSLLYQDVYTPRQFHIFAWYAILLAISIILILPLSLYYEYRGWSEKIEKKSDDDFVASPKSGLGTILKNSILSLFIVMVAAAFVYLVLLIRWL